MMECHHRHHYYRVLFWIDDAGMMLLLLVHFLQGPFYSMTTRGMLTVFWGPSYKLVSSSMLGLLEGDISSALDVG
jgi:hypothetical protein